MTVIVNVIWGGRICQVVDRQITRRAISGEHVAVVDQSSTKVCTVLCSDALLTIAYTGVAVANLQWMDSVVASCLAHRNLSSAMMQPGAPLLARPAHVVINELAINLNGRLNHDSNARLMDLQVTVAGWHLGPGLRPLSWELKRDAPDPNGLRYFKMEHNKVGKFLRENPGGLWLEYFGDTDASFVSHLHGLEAKSGYTHDDVERYVVDGIRMRSSRTLTVGSSCLAVQLDQYDPDGQVQFTYYPSGDAADMQAPTFLTGWVLTPRLISSPGTETTFGCQYSPCGQYVVGGFSDGNTNLHVRTRLPSAGVHFGGPSVMGYGTQKRKALL